MNKFVLFLFFLISATNAFGESVLVSLADSGKKKINTEIELYKNELGILEGKITAEKGIYSALGARPIIGYGVDTDNNEKLDTWFIISKSGLTTYFAEGELKHGQDGLFKALRQSNIAKDVEYKQELYNELVSYILFSASYGQQRKNEIYRDWMKVELLTIMLDKQARSLSREQLVYTTNLIIAGYQKVTEDIESLYKKDYLLRVAADEAIAVATLGLGELAAKIAPKLVASKFVSQKILGQKVLKILLNAFDRQIAVLRNRVITMKATGVIATDMAINQLTSTAIKEVISTSTRALFAKQKVLNMAFKSKDFALSALKNMGLEWKYIGLNVGMQTISEVSARWNDIYDPNPLVMARNLVMNRDFLQNMEYMTAETALMTGISSSLKSTKAKFLSCALVAITNSTITNYFFRPSVDGGRVAFDTAWEVIIGNTEVQFDLAALAFFERLSLKNNNPKLKLVGYAVTLIDMGVIYYGYSKASTYVDEKLNELKMKQQMKLVPIFANVD